MRLSIATKVFLGFVAVLACSAAVSAYGVARLRRIGQGLSLLSRPYMPLTRAVSTLEAFHKERVRNTDRLLEDSVTRLKTAQRRVDYEVRDLGRILQDQMNQGVDEAEKQERAARWAILALSGIALLVGLLVTWLSHRALRPIRTLTEAAQRLG